MSEMRQFMYEGTRQVRSLMRDDGLELWCGNDVCRILGLRNRAAAYTRLDDDEKHHIAFTDVVGKSHSMVFVTESGLFTLILRSHLPEARAFKRWITHEVLPQIRRTGQYQASRQAITSLYVAPKPRRRQTYYTREFYFHLYRLSGKLDEFPDTTCYDPWTGHYIDLLIYRRSFPPGVMATIRAQNPRMPYGGRVRRHGQHLTEDLGERHLLAAVDLCIRLMRIARGLAHLLYMLDTIAPVHQRELPFREVFQGQLTITRGDYGHVR